MPPVVNRVCLHSSSQTWKTEIKRKGPHKDHVQRSRHRGHNDDVWWCGTWPEVHHGPVAGMDVGPLHSVCRVFKIWGRGFQFFGH